MIASFTKGAAGFGSVLSSVLGIWLKRLQRYLSGSSDLGRPRSFVTSIANLMLGFVRKSNMPPEGIENGDDEESPTGNHTSHNQPTRNPRSRKPNYNQIHALPLPLNIQPLPVLIPHNPLSIAQIIYTYLSQLRSSYTSHPPCLYTGYLSLESRSVNVTDPATVRCLWEKGFFGKGSLSRSEPTWLEREMKRRGIIKGETSEEATQKRRHERREFKKERARKEREAIEKQLRDEGKAGATADGQLGHNQSMDCEKATHSAASGGLSMDSLAVSGGNLAANLECHQLNHSPRASTTIGDVAGHGSEGKTEESLGDGLLSEHNRSKNELSTQQNSRSPEPAGTSNSVHTVLNQEHLQLTLEEAFFLSYGLGVLEIRGEESKDQIPVSSLFSLSRRLSYFPPRQSDTLQMDDPFILSYAVYHHFRSLGWVVRSGVKFAVDYLLYNRGPVFSHAEFAVVILPSYSHPYYSQSSAQRQLSKERQPWWWLHCINRVQSQARKSLVLAYVEVPPPDIDNEKGTGSSQLASTDISRLLKSYKIREINIKRWIPNRSRD